MSDSGFTLPSSVRQCGVICSDGVELMGLASVAVRGAEPQVVLLFIPGQFDNAYQQHKNHALLHSFVAAGYGCVLANSRGQDYYGYQRHYPDPAQPTQYTWKLLGSSLERVREGHLDISAWLSYVNESYPRARVILAGHSHGAIKIAHYMRESASDCVGAVVLLSPSDDLANQRKSLGDRYDEALKIAQVKIDEGKSESLMPEWTFSAPMSAGTYAEAFGPDTPLRIFAFHDPQSSPLWDGRGWLQPTLVMFGSDDIATGQYSSEEAGGIARQLLKQCSRADTVVLPDTNHHYRGAEKQAAADVLDWSRAVLHT